MTSIKKAVRVHMLTVCLTVSVNLTTVILADFKLLSLGMKIKNGGFVCFPRLLVLSFAFFSGKCNVVCVGFLMVSDG